VERARSPASRTKSRKRRARPLRPVPLPGPAGKTAPLCASLTRRVSPSGRLLVRRALGVSPGLALHLSDTAFARATPRLWPCRRIPGDPRPVPVERHGRCSSAPDASNTADGVRVTLRRAGQPFPPAILKVFGRPRRTHRNRIHRRTPRPQACDPDPEWPGNSAKEGGKGLCFDNSGASLGAGIVEFRYR
jgi:hypothetical protein